MMGLFFKDHLGKNIEVHVDDLVVMIKPSGNHLINLEEIFQIFRHFQMRLNPTKCTFGVSDRKFLGFLISEWGIEVNPD